MDRLSIFYVQFASLSKDGKFETYVEQFNHWLDTFAAGQIRAVQHVDFLYASQDALMANNPSGARWMVTLAS